jgi:hypothetical protein
VKLPQEILFGNLVISLSKQESQIFLNEWIKSYMELPRGSNIFIDTNVFLALENADDALHQRALEVWSRFENLQPKLFTSIFILSETLTVLSLRVSKIHAIRFGERVLGSKVF